MAEEQAEANRVGRLGALGPAYTRGEIEAPAGERSEGTAIIGVYTPEQQARLGVDEFGEKAANRLEIRAAKMEGMQARADAKAAERAAGGGAAQGQPDHAAIGGTPGFEERDDLRESVVLKIEGLSCGGCVANVTKALEAVAGVTSAKVSL